MIFGYMTWQVWVHIRELEKCIFPPRSYRFVAEARVRLDIYMRNSSLASVFHQVVVII